MNPTNKKPEPSLVPFTRAANKSDRRLISGPVAAVLCTLIASLTVILVLTLRTWQDAFVDRVGDFFDVFDSNYAAVIGIVLAAFYISREKHKSA